MSISQYETTDMGLAAYLLVEGFTLDHIKDHEYSPNKKVFVFNRKQRHRVEDVASIYMRREGEVEPQQYNFNLKQLKSRMYN